MKKKRIVILILSAVVILAIVLALCLKKSPEPVKTKPIETPKATEQNVTPEPTETTAEADVPTESSEAIDEDIQTQREGIFG